MCPDIAIKRYAAFRLWKDRILIASPRSIAAVPSLSSRLRAQTAPLHWELEGLLGLPSSIRTRSDYLTWICRFLGLYDPLERIWSALPEWEALGLALPRRGHTECLIKDLAALGVDPYGVRRAAPAQLPNLPTFAHMLGGVYVLEGATLGGRVILRDVMARVGPSIDGATHFFGGRGDAVTPMWQSFRVALDSFGGRRPQDQGAVVEGAERAFRAMLSWFALFCGDAVCLP